MCVNFNIVAFVFLITVQAFASDCASKRWDGGGVAEEMGRTSSIIINKRSYNRPLHGYNGAIGNIIRTRWRENKNFLWENIVT